MLQLTQCRLPYEQATEERLKKKIAELLHLREEELRQVTIVKKSVDARRKPHIDISYTVRFRVEDEERVWRRNRNRRTLSRVSREPSLRRKIRPIVSDEKIVVVGAGPAGLFCAYYLCLCGLRPIVIERGAPMEERVADVEKFWQDGKLDPDSNVSFGEGGAGTFSDGKLNTGVKDRTGRKQFVLESFIRFGAPENIRYDAGPHIGTDVLRHVIVSMRREMEEKGCTFLFHSALTDFTWKGEGGTLAVRSGESERELPCSRLVLAIGHSARDTFSMLFEKGMAISQKPFAMGVRIEHRQEKIDRAQYGVCDNRLPPASYKLTGRTSDGRGIYSFCMCPGGYVVNASTEQKGLAVNGMSDAARDSGYANSAIVVTVSPEDFGSAHPLAGIEFQRRYERRMYELAGGRIPIQRYGDFVRGKETEICGEVPPCVKGKWKWANLQEALPKFVVNGMIDGMGQFATMIRGFDEEDALLLGLESRTSSPVRIERDEGFESLSFRHIYPCGEGAGYAGGIMSAAMDGLRVAMAIQGTLEMRNGETAVCVQE